MKTTTTPPNFRPTLLWLTVSAALNNHSVFADEVKSSDVPFAQQKQIEQQQHQIQELSTTLKAVQEQMKQLSEQNEALANQQEQMQQAGANAPKNKASLWGYGEMYYTRPTRNNHQAVADLGRAVFGIGYQFSDATRFGSEFEWEHAVTSAKDQGETEIEQFWVDHTINDTLALQAGLFLIPAGYLNLSHEPTQYYGVQRNFVESLIIPSTWREGGVALHGVTASGINWNAGLTTGLNLSAWNFNPEQPLYSTAAELLNSSAAPMRATHQEMQLAVTRTPSGYVALNYNGVPGFNVGGTVFTGEMVKAAESLPNNQGVTLWEAHTRWTPGKWDLSALYAHGNFSHTAEANALFPGATNPVPSEFLGYFAQVAYSLWQQGELRLVPFTRWEHYDMGASYETLASGATVVPKQVPGQSPWPQPRDNVWTVGTNLFVTPNVVFKADYQRFGVNDNFTRVDLGLGLAF